MTQEAKKTVVNSWNEWDPLKHIVLGRCDGTMFQAAEPAIQRDWAEDGYPMSPNGKMLPQDMIDKGN